MLGAGGHHVWMDPEHAAVVVLRWLDAAVAPQVIAGLAAALSAAPQGIRC
jgi:hypothetical protein